MAEILVVFDAPIPTEAGLHYARVCGDIAADGLWEAWVEFLPVGAGDPASSEWIRSARETEQPNLDDLKYWAEGLTVAYLQGAFRRATEPSPSVTHTDVLPPKPERRATPKSVPFATAAGPRPIIDPFAVYNRGERVLRRQLSALNNDQLLNVAGAYNLPDAAAPNLTQTDRVRAIINSVKAKTGRPGLG